MAKTKSRSRAGPHSSHSGRGPALNLPGYNSVATAGDCWYDREAGERPIHFFRECLRHSKGEKAGQPFILEPWQDSILRNLFGWKRPDGTRRYREAFIYIPRKNGKTTLAAGIGNYLLFCDGEPGAEIYCAAKDREQASRVFEVAKAMVAQDDVLRQHAEVYVKSITRESEGASFKAISADASTKHGYNSHAVIVDELHAQRDRELVDVLVTSTGARRQPVIIYITTADFQRVSICNEKYDYAKKVRDGIIEDPSFLPVIYEASREDDWKDPDIWNKANPCLGVSLSEEYIRRECQKAAEVPAYENTFKRLHLNIQTEQDCRAIVIEKWDASGGGPVTADALAGRPCYAGLDLADVHDVAAFVLVFPDGDRRIVLPIFWVPRDSAVARERRDRVPYLAWARQGFVELTEGEAIDYDVIRDRINELGDKFDIRGIAIDRFGAQQLATQLTQDGFPVKFVNQGMAGMAAPFREMERLYLDKKLVHGGNPVLRWMASNLAVEEDHAGNRRPAKKRSYEKIDGVVALVMAIGWVISDVGKTESVYDRENRGFFTIG